MGNKDQEKLTKGQLIIVSAGAIPIVLYVTRKVSDGPEFWFWAVFTVVGGIVGVVVYYYDVIDL